MKKCLSVLFVTVLMITLTGCGKGNKLTCSKDNEKLTVSFVKNKVNKITSTVTYNTESEAMMVEALFNNSNTNGISVKRNGAEIEATYSEEAVNGMGNYTGTKDDIRKIFEEEGYNCK